MPQKLRNSLGSILPRTVTRGGRTVTVFEARRRYTGHGGKKNEKSKRCLTRKEASMMLHRFQREIEMELVAPEVREVTFFEAVEHFREHYVKPAVIVGGRQLEGYRMDLRVINRELDEFREFFGDPPLRQIDYEALHRYYVVVCTTPTPRGTVRTVSTVNNKLKFLRRIFSIAFQKRWVDINPFHSGKALIVPSAANVRQRLITHAEEMAVLAECRGRYYAHLQPLIICAADTAMRSGEIFALRWKDVDLFNRLITLSGENTKTMMPGLIGITSRLYQAFVDLQQRSAFTKPGDQIFPYRSVKKAFSTVCRRAGVEDIQLRDFRTAAATRMQEAGTPEALVRKITRHSVASDKNILRKHYTVLDAAGARKIAENLQQYNLQEFAKVNIGVNSSPEQLTLVSVNR